MGTFQSEFHGFSQADKDKFQVELRSLYTARVNELTKAGMGIMEAERTAIRDVKVAFLKQHPELTTGNWAIRVVQP